MNPDGWTDAHAHPTDLSCVSTALERASSFSIHRVLGNSTHPGDWVEMDRLSRTYPQVVPGFGIHPWKVSGLASDWLETLTEVLLSRPEALVGEIGLDRKLTDQPMDLQQEICLRQVELANRLNRPCTLHVVGAWAELAEVLEQAAPRRMLLHSFGGSPEQVGQFDVERTWFSFGGAVIRQSNSTKLQDAVRAVPAERLLLETDAPYQHPDGKEREQEPAGLLRIAERVAELRGMPVDELRRMTERNTEGFLTGCTGSTG
jgi:TatD DNase family protein